MIWGRENVLRKNVTVSNLTLFVSATSFNIDAATKLKVHFVDVGQGDTTVIQYGNSYSLIDTGTENNYHKLKSEYLSINKKIFQQWNVFLFFPK